MLFCEVMVKSDMVDLILWEKCKLCNTCKYNNGFVKMRTGSIGIRIHSQCMELRQQVGFAKLRLYASTSIPK